MEVHFMALEHGSWEVLTRALRSMERLKHKYLHALRSASLENPRHIYSVQQHAYSSTVSIPRCK